MQSVSQSVNWAKSTRSELAVSFSPYLFIFGDLTPILIFFYYLDIFFFIYLGIYLFIADSRCKHPFLCEPPGMWHHIIWEAHWLPHTHSSPSPSLLPLPLCLTNQHPESLVLTWDLPVGSRLLWQHVLVQAASCCGKEGGGGGGGEEGRGRAIENERKRLKTKIRKAGRTREKERGSKGPWFSSCYRLLLFCQSSRWVIFPLFVYPTPSSPPQCQCQLQAIVMRVVWWCNAWQSTCSLIHFAWMNDIRVPLLCRACVKHVCVSHLG